MKALFTVAIDVPENQKIMVGLFAILTSEETILMNFIVSSQVRKAGIFYDVIGFHELIVKAVSSMCCWTRGKRVFLGVRPSALCVNKVRFYDGFLP